MDQKQGAFHATTQSRPRPPLLLALISLCTASALVAQDLEYTTAQYSYWYSIVCSGEGRVIVTHLRNAGGFDSYISTDSGATFRHFWIYGGNNALTPDAGTLVVVRRLVAYSSHDLGASWETHSLPGTNVDAVVISDDGTKWVCANTSGQGTIYNTISGEVYVSTNAGASWQLTSAPITNWTSIALSGNGTRLAAVYGSNQVYLSSDNGLTWTNTTPASPTNSLYLVVSSRDGNKLVAIGKGIVCVSTNAGSDWDTVGSAPAGILSVAASADASTLALVSGLSLFTSTNSGALWTQRVTDVGGTPVYYNVSSAAISADGSRLLSASAPGLIFTWPLPPALLTFSTNNNSLLLSWPSNQVGFVLETTPSLSSAAGWTPVTNTIFASNYRYTVTNAMSAPSALYRLHKP